MKQTAKATGIEGRIINLSSIAHTYTYEEGVRFDDINDQIGYVCLHFNSTLLLHGYDVDVDSYNFTTTKNYKYCYKFSVTLTRRLMDSPS